MCPGCPASQPPGISSFGHECQDVPKPSVIFPKKGDEPAMNIVVCVKYVPDAQSDLTFIESDNTIDRLGVDGLLSELDEYAVEAGLKLAESAAEEGKVTVLTIGPDKAADGIKKSLQFGADAGVDRKSVV